MALYTGMAMLPPFMGFHLPYLHAAERGEILEQYRRCPRALIQTSPLSFLSLVDERLNPH